MSAIAENPPAVPVAPRKKPSFWTVHNVSLKLHLWLGLASALFLLILGATGTVMAFESYADRWLHPSLWYVKVTGQPLPEAQLIQKVEQQVPGKTVRNVTFNRHDYLAQVMQVAPVGKSVDTPGAAMLIFVNPYDGSVLGTRTGVPTSQKVLAAIHQFHLRMAIGEWGVFINSVASSILIFEVIFGLVIWFRTKRATIKFSGSWYRIFFDTHSAFGLYTAIIILLFAVTGILIGFEWAEPLIFKLTKSEPMVQRRLPSSTVVEGAQPISPDKAMELGRAAIPIATVATLQLPARPNGTYVVGLRVPEETSEAVHSLAVVDQYSGKVLKVQNYMTDSMGYRVIRYNRSLHTGDVYGFPTHLIMSFSSFALVVMVITGIVIWWKKLAV